MSEPKDGDTAETIRFEDLVDNGSPATLEQTLDYYDRRYGAKFEEYMNQSFRDASDDLSQQDSQYYHACLTELRIRNNKTPDITRQEKYAELMLSADIQRIKARIDYLEKYVGANESSNSFRETVASNITELDLLKGRRTGLENTHNLISSAKHLRRNI